MAEKDKKYYWLKLKRDFFKRHDIQIIEGMPNGKDYILFYLKLLCESVDHEGNLRFSEEIPYNEEMLATLTHTNIDIVRSAVKLFAGLHMIEILDDGTYYMNQVRKMIGSETYWAQKKREQREAEPKALPPLDIVQRLSNDCPTCPSKSIEKEKDIDLDKELDKDISYVPQAEASKPTKNKRFIPPTLQEVQDYCRERQNNVDAERFIDYYESNGWMVGKNKMKDWKAAVRTWEKNGYNSKTVIQSRNTEQSSGNPFYDMYMEEAMKEDFI